MEEGAAIGPRRRPPCAGRSYFVRWFAAAAAPFVAPKLADHFGMSVPFEVAAAAAAVAMLVAVAQRKHLAHDAGQLLESGDARGALESELAAADAAGPVR